MLNIFAGKISSTIRGNDQETPVLSKTRLSREYSATDSQKPL